MTEKSNIVGEVVIAVTNVLLSSVELLRDALREPYVDDDVFNTDPVCDETGRDLRTSNVFSSRFGQLITGHVREASGRADAVPLFLFCFLTVRRRHARLPCTLVACPLATSLRLCGTRSWARSSWLSSRS